MLETDKWVSTVGNSALNTHLVLRFWLVCVDNWIPTGIYEKHCNNVQQKVYNHRLYVC